MIGTIIGGFVVGAIACAVKPGKDNVGWIMTIVIGVVGMTLSKLLFGKFIGLGSITLIPSIFVTIGLLYAYDRFFG